MYHLCLAEGCRGYGCFPTGMRALGGRPLNRDPDGVFGKLFRSANAAERQQHAPGHRKGSARARSDVNGAHFSTFE